MVVEQDWKYKGDDGRTEVAYLGENVKTNEMIFQLQSKSKIDKRQVMMMIDENGGRFDSLNKMGENVVRLDVAWRRSFKQEIGAKPVNWMWIQYARCTFCPYWN